VKLVKLRREEIERWQAERREAVTGSTANKELMRLGHVLNRAVAWGYIRANPARGIKRAKEAPGRVRYLSPEERDKLLNGADVTVKATDGRTWTVHREPNPSLKLYILAALQTGARRGELAALTWGGVDMKARTLTFRHTKNGHARTVPMTDTLREALADLPRPLSPEARVLPERDLRVLSRAFARLVSDLEIPNLRFHDLRHDAASTLTMAGVPQRAVMEILGHRDPRMTMRYQHLSPGHLKDAMRALDHAAPRPADQQGNGAATGTTGA
jgi:integrase